MGIAAVCLWAVTAAAGLVLLGTWIAKGGVHRMPGGRGRHRRLSRTLVFGHVLLAAAGLLVWIAYLALASSVLSWAALAIVILVAVLGLAMFVRWVPTYRGRARLGTGPGAAAHRAQPSPRQPPEQHFPILVVATHGVLAVTTVVLVVLTALGVR
jgi:hypothetical protein